MKQTLRMFCMGLAAAASVAGFAQEPQSVTDKLWNADFEKGVHGWDVVANDNCWMPVVKEGKAPGYYGFNNLCLEIWKAAGSGVQDNSLSQTLTGLPDGTYVFGAHMMATDDSWEQSIADVQGVYLFANDATVSVATNRVEGISDEKWAHAAKFNVAATVTGGELKVGAYCEFATASFLCIDNATLYYFGDMEKGAALNEMAKIDMAASLAIADTCVGLKMNADTLAYLNQAIEAAKALANADEAYQLAEDLYWGMRLARKSAEDYESLAASIAAAKEMAAKEWSEFVQEDVTALNELIAAAEAGYEANIVNRTEIEALKDNLVEACARLELDIYYVMLDEYAEKINNLTIGTEVGEFSQESQDLMNIYLEEVRAVLSGIEDGEISAVDGDNTCKSLYAEIDKLLDSPIEYATFPIVTKRADTKLMERNYCFMEGMVLNGGRPSYTSKVYRFREPLTKIRFTVLETGDNGLCGNYVFFSLSALELYDESGNMIPLSASDITSNADHNSINPNALDGQGIPALIDGDPYTYFHSAWKNAPNESPYIEFTLPEGEYSAFSFKLEARDGYDSQVPVVVDIRYVSDAVSDLKVVYDNALALNPRKGTAPGFYSAGVDEYNAAMAEAKRLIEADYADDAEVDAAIAALNGAIDNVKKYFILPEPGKEYRIISGYGNFMKLQSVHKTLTTHPYPPYGERLWWENADPDSLKQVFTLEPIENDENKLYYAIKSVNCGGRYLGEYTMEDGVKVLNLFALSEHVDTFLLKDLGDGQFGIIREGHDREMFHCLDHLDGIPSTKASGNGIEGGIEGIASSVCTWAGAADSPSAWAFRELKKLPFEAKSISDLNFQSESISLYSGIKTITLTADKECVFADLVITDILGNTVPPVSVEVKGNMATVELENVLGELVFSFTNTEGVETVVFNGRGDLPEYTALQTAYDDAVAMGVVEGPEVGQIADAKAFNTALANAQALLVNGGETEDLVAAKEAIDAAVAGLVYNLPVAGQNYFIQSALPWMDRWGSEMDIFIRDDLAYWSYVNIKNLSHQWQFVDCGQQKNGMPAYYLLNVGTGFYLTTPRLEGNTNDGWLYVVEDTVEAATFNIHFLNDGKVAIADSREGNANGSWALHPLNHSSGTGYVAHGKVITYRKGDAASAMRVITAEKVIDAFMTGIEDVEIAGEQAAPAVKGIYDLYGRRIETPAATGIYIVDGKKLVIKK